MEHLQAAGMKDFKISVVMAPQNLGQFDDFKAIAAVTTLSCGSRGSR
jgi:hypothetical protein